MDVLTDIDDDGNNDDTFGKGVYLQACDELGVRPVSQILKFLELDTLHVTHYGLGSKGATAVARALAHNKTVTAVRFGDNSLGGEGAAVLCDAVCKNHEIVELDLSRNDLSFKGGEVRPVPRGSEEEAGRDGASSPPHPLEVGGTAKLRSLAFRGGEALSRLARASAVTTLVLSDNQLGDKAVGILADAVGATNKLKFLDLSRNELGEVAGRRLGEMLSVNISLNQLDLSWNKFRAKGAAALCQGMLSNQALEVLQLGWNGIGDEGAVAICEMLTQNERLIELSLSGNGFTEVGFGHIGQGLAVNKALAAIELNQNMLAQVGQVRAVAADGTVSSPNQSLVGTQHITQAVEANKGIVYVNLENTNGIPKLIEEMNGVLEERREKARTAAGL